MRTATLLLPASLLLATIQVPALAADAGAIVRYQGPVEVRGRAQARPASEAMSLKSGDTVVVGERGLAQLRFEDESVFVLPASSQFRIDDYRTGRPGKAIYTLERGGVRTITGAIGKTKGDQYELRAPQAKITVRGTAYSTLLCDGRCGAGLRNGLYVRNESGGVTVANGAGKLALRPGETAFVESQSTAPVKVTVSPFQDPAIAAAFEAEVSVEVEVHPPRIENDPPASPS